MEQIGGNVDWQPEATAPVMTWVKTMKQGETGTNKCFLRIIDGDREWIGIRGYSNIINPGSFAAPTHWAVL